MKKETSNNAYILTGDEPIKSSTIKRLLLFHNKVLFSNIKDEAIINDNEVIEYFPNSQITKVWWSSRGHYPRIKEYTEKYYKYLEGTEAAFKRNLLESIESKNIKTIDPGIHWMSHNASLSDYDLIKSASIDASLLKPDIPIPNTIIKGGEIVPSGMKSKYSVEYKESIVLPNVHDDWNTICQLRVGRALKSIRIAQALNASPVAIDNVNSNITLTLMQKNNPFTFTNDSLMDYSINMEVIDDKKLESILLDASWDDVLKLRKEILPTIGKTKQFLTTRSKKISNTTYTSVEQYLEALKELKTDFSYLQEKELEAWEALRIGSIFKAGGAMGAMTLGTLAIPTLTTVPNIFLGLISTGLVATSALTDELKQLIPAKRKVKDNPLFILEKLNILKDDN
ncbi:hypothetical protein [Halarcobacter ebronensis]|uniref:Uncharacterized protein n=1 Tax=Halarcobacter ebronensis TaxID=1462615 RepID=A0A4Q1AKP4_9BACT|nr:hypothetical protein [Halarcobacter ebronensis]QKF81552.1 hypothetical protein AEBR_1055 [Halarcobacter ebronensis]RXK05480.1 hypothetical protein CRV07_08185 [Halarcobacter ebronensis]